MYERIGVWVVVAASMAVVAVIAITHRFSVVPQPVASGSAHMDKQHEPPILQTAARSFHTDLDPAEGHLQLSSDAAHHLSNAADSPYGSTIRPTSARSSDFYEQTPEESGTDAKASAADPISRSFPLSQSIRDQCEESGRQATNTICDSLYRALAAMAEEPVDSQWAFAIEAQLRAKITGAGQYTVRSVECRTTTCAIEVVSADGDFLAYRIIAADQRAEPRDQRLSGSNRSRRRPVGDGLVFKTAPIV